MKFYEYPQDFIWGTALSAHQTEGNNTNSEWWHWEQQNFGKKAYPKAVSGMACDSYHRYDEDFSLACKANTTAIRISIEWARIEPEEGKFDEKELEHYRQVLKSAKSHGLKTFVTLHHFTNPMWSLKLGGWTNLRAPKLLSRYACYIAQNLDELIDAYITINEPQVYTYKSYFDGTWPPNKKSYVLALLVQVNLVLAHNKAYKSLKTISKKPIGLAKHIVRYERSPDSSLYLDKIYANFIYFLNSHLFLLPICKNLDFIGLNYYFTDYIHNLKKHPLSDWTSDMGWWIFPNGLLKTLVNLKYYNLPIYITENGLADANDKSRSRFLDKMLAECSNAINKGVQLKGYFYWSLLDNFEWHEGYWPKFGLIEVKRDSSFERVPRKSFYHYGEICKNNMVTDYETA